MKDLFNLLKDEMSFNKMKDLFNVDSKKNKLLTKIIIVNKFETIPGFCVM